MSVCKTGMSTVMLMWSCSGIILKPSKCPCFVVACCSPRSCPEAFAAVQRRCRQELHRRISAVQSLGHLWSCRNLGIGQEMPEDFLASVKRSGCLVSNCGDPSTVFSQVPFDKAPSAAACLPASGAIEIISSFGGWVSFF